MRSRSVLHPALEATTALTLIAVVVAGCGAGDTRGSAPAVRDSAGIEIVEHAAGAEPPAEWRVSAEPRLEIGVVDGEPEYQFTRIAGGAVLSDGRIAVLDQRQHVVRFYDAEGTFLASSGGEGAGPGELFLPMAMHRLPGDTLVVWNAPVRARRTVLDPRGEYVRSVAVDRAAIRLIAGAGHVTEHFTPLPDGTVVAHFFAIRRRGEPRPEGMFRPDDGFIRTTIDGARADTLGWFGGIEQMLVSVGGRDVPTVNWFSPFAYVGAGGDPMRIYAGDAERWEVRVFAADGTLERLIRRPNARRPAPPEAVEQARRERLEWAESSGRRAQHERQIAALPDDPLFPAFGGLVVGRDGNLWVQDYPSPLDERGRWTVFDPGGRMLARVVMPPAICRDVSPLRSCMLDVGPDHVLGVRRDELEVEHVVLYDLGRT